MKTITQIMVLGKDTKGTQTYVDPDDGGAKVPTVYIKKTAFDGEPPSQIKLIIEDVKK